MDSEQRPFPQRPSEASAGRISPVNGSLRHAWMVGLGLLLLSAASVAGIDHGCSGYLRTHKLSGEINNLFQAVEHFGTPYGAVLILVTVWLNVPVLRSRISRTFSAAIAAGLAADLVKLCVSRTRPNIFEFDQSIWSSFTGVCQWGAGGSRHQGFPSAHSAFAISFAVMLGEMFPRSRRWFLGIGVLVTLQRVAATAHFPSDVLAGAAVGLVTAHAFLGPTRIGRYFDSLERRYFPELSSVPTGADCPTPAALRVTSIVECPSSDAA